MKALDERSVEDVRRYRNSRLYRSLTRTLRVYNKRLIAELHARGFTDFSAAFPQILSNLDTAGTRVGVLANRAGITRQAAGQLIAEIESCGYVRRRPAPDDARATIVQHTQRGRRLLETIFELVEDIEGTFGRILRQGEFESVRSGLARLADEIDREGGFGSSDEQSPAS